MTDSQPELERRLRAAGGALAVAPPPIAPRIRDAGLLDVAYTEHDTPVGRLLLAATDRGVVRIAYLDEDETGEAALEQLAERISPRILRAPAQLDGPRRELDEFFAGARRRFDVPLDLRLSSSGFRRRVMRATARIPYGEVSSYRQIAVEAGSPGAFRAAGTALGQNPLPIVIPCHRVLHVGGGLGGYTGGVERKRTLLTIEGA